MPLERCENDFRAGFKWGQDGTCWTGPNGRKNALKQGLGEQLENKRLNNTFDYAEFKDVTISEIAEALAESDATSTEQVFVLATLLSAPKDENNSNATANDEN